MNSKCILKACTAAAIVCGSVYAKEAEKPVVQEEKEMSLSDFVSAEVSVALDSKFVSYGLIDNKDPIVTPAASLTFFDTAYLGVSAIFDTSTYGKKAGYGNRGGRYIAYYDFLFDQHIRDAADDYEATGSDDSSNFVCGLAVTASF